MSFASNGIEISFIDLIESPELHEYIDSSIYIDVDLLCISDQPSNQLVYVNASINSSFITAQVSR